MRVLRGISTGLLSAAFFGAVLGLSDGIRATLAGGSVLTPRDWLGATAVYAGLWMLPGAVAGLAGLLFRRPVRATVLLAGVGSAAFAVGAYMNVLRLPSFASPASLRFDAALLAGAAVLFAILYRLPRPFRAPSAKTWLALLALPFLAGLAARLAVPATEAQAVKVLADPGRRPDVYVVLCDTLRADHLGALGYGRQVSPRFDAFAAGAAVLTDFRAASTWTKPSTASIHTGLLPSSHGAVEHHEVLAPPAVTLAEAFRAGGYRTAAFSDNPFVTPEFGFGQGFDHFDGLSPSPFANGTLLGKVLWTLGAISIDGRPFAPRLPPGRGTPDLVRRALRWLGEGEDADRPAFVYFHCMEPHVPYDPPAPFRGRFADPAYAGPDLSTPPAYQGMLPFETGAALPEDQRRHLVDRYDEEILAWDAGFGSLLDGLSAADRLAGSIVVVLSDHGEEFFEHGAWKHGHSLLEEVVRVPFAVQGPGIPPGRHSFPARATDVFPTLLSLAGLRAEHPPFGVDLADPLLGGAAPRSAPVVAEVAFGGAGARSVVEGERKVVEAHRGEEQVTLAFDLAVDPWEHAPLTAPPWEADLSARLAQVLEAARAVAIRSGARALTDAERQRFRGLGYFH